MIVHRRSDVFLSIWEYLVEGLVALAVYYLLRRLLGPAIVGRWILAKRVEWSAAAWAAAAIATVLWGVYLAFLTTEFGAKLREFRVASVYSFALSFPILVFAMTGLSSLFIEGSNSGFLLQAICLLLLYALINFVTLVRNLHGLVTVWQDFDRARKFGK